MSKHSTIVGGSTAARILNCPGSQSLIATLPDAVDQPSVFATEGTALHQVMAELIVDPENIAEEYLDKTITVEGEGDIRITQELLHDCLLPAIGLYDTVLCEAIGDGDPILVEQRVAFPGIDGAFGTSDLIAFNPQSQTTHIWDWKFGAGVPVAAYYPDPDDPEYEIVNPQLLFYACAARATLPHMFDRGGNVKLVIVQPRAPDIEKRFTMATVSHRELDDFEKGLRRAVEIAKLEGAPKRMGDWCRFAPCRTICPLQLAPLLDMTEILPPENARMPQTAEVLSAVMALAEILEPVIAEARRQAHEILESGGQIPGYKLVPKRANRSWVGSEKDVLGALRRLKILKNNAYNLTLKSPAQIEKILPRGKALPEALVAKVSSGTTIARSDDPRPDAAAAITDMADIIASLTEGNGQA